MCKPCWGNWFLEINRVPPFPKKGAPVSQPAVNLGEIGVGPTAGLKGPLKPFVKKERKGNCVCLLKREIVSLASALVEMAGPPGPQNCPQNGTLALEFWLGNEMN